MACCLLACVLSAPATASDCVPVDLPHIDWLASVNEDLNAGTLGNHASIVIGEDEHGAYYGMEWSSPKPTDLSLNSLDNVGVTGADTVALTLSASEPMTVDVWLGTNGDYCNQAWQNATIARAFVVGPTPQRFELTLADFVVNPASACNEELHEDALERMYSIVLLPSSLSGELNVYDISFCGPNVEPSWCSSAEARNVLRNGDFEDPTINQAIAQGAEGEPGAAAWFLEVPDWEHSVEPGYCRGMVIDGTQCFYWNDPVDAWMEQSVDWETLDAEVGDVVELSFWRQVSRADGARVAGKTIEFGAELRVADAIMDSLAISGGSDPALSRLSFTVAEEHIGLPITARFWASGNHGWTGYEEVQSVYLDHVVLVAESADRPLRAQGVCSPRAGPLSGPNVTVEFPDPSYYMAFDPPSGGFYYVDGIFRFGNEWAETNVSGGCYEVGFDWNARMWIESASPARIVVRFRGALVNEEGEIAHTDSDSGSPYGDGDWADEWYYIYPSGVSSRHIRIYTGYALGASSFWWPGAPAGFETQETFINGLIPGHQPLDDIEIDAVTLAKTNGAFRRISFLPYPAERDLYPGANIQIVNVKNVYKPFTIVPEGNTDIMPYKGPPIDQANLYSTKLVAWPRVPYFEDGYMCALTHVINRSWHRQSETTLEQIYLIGLIEAASEEDRVAELAQLALSWQYAPTSVVTAPGYVLSGYRIEEKAYHFAVTDSVQLPLVVDFASGADRPLVDPCLVIQGWPEGTPVHVSLNGQALELGTGFYYGFEDDVEGRTSLVVWINAECTTPTTIQIAAK